MIRKLTRIAVVLTGMGLCVWLGRLIAHSKVPPPEGRWREITTEELE